MSSEKKRLSSVFTRIGHGKKKHDDSDDEFDAKVQSIAQEMEHPEGVAERASSSTISRMKNKLGSMRITPKRNSLDKQDKVAPPPLMDEKESIIATATIAKRSPSSDTVEFSPPVAGGGDEGQTAQSTQPIVDEADGTAVAPDLLKRRVSEVLEFEPACGADSGDKNAPVNIVSKVTSRPVGRAAQSPSSKSHKDSLHSHSAAATAAAILPPEEHHVGDSPGRSHVSHRRISKWEGLGGGVESYSCCLVGVVDGVD